MGINNKILLAFQTIIAGKWKIKGQFFDYTTGSKIGTNFALVDE